MPDTKNPSLHEMTMTICRGSVARLDHAVKLSLLENTALTAEGDALDAVQVVVNLAKIGLEQLAKDPERGALSPLAPGHSDR